MDHVTAISPRDAYTAPSIAAGVTSGTSASCGGPSGGKAMKRWSASWVSPVTIASTNYAFRGVEPDAPGYRALRRRPHGIPAARDDRAQLLDRGWVLDGFESERVTVH